jgi:hypothetical protein
VLARDQQPSEGGRSDADGLLGDSSADRIHAPVWAGILVAAMVKMAGMRRDT